MVVRRSLKMSLFLSCISPKTDDLKEAKVEELGPSEEEVRQWSESFDKVMLSCAGRRVFREFLRTEFSEENLLFWLACEELKKEEDPQKVEEKARLIYEDYISIISPREDVAGPFIALANVSTQFIQQNAQHIFLPMTNYEDRIPPSSEVSLDARVRDVINKNIAKPTRQTFDDAQFQIFTLMQRDSYPRFLNSQTYRQLLR